MSFPDATRRFSDRVETYRRYRPSYPAPLVPFVVRELELPRSSTIADLGSGTGLLARLFLAAGHTVYGVEPNRAMAAAAREELRVAERFFPVAGRAEATGLRGSSIDLATAGQAFHWFEVEATRAELQRILRPGGGVTLVWNLRLRGTPFLDAYGAFLRRWGRDYEWVAQGKAEPSRLERLFGHAGYAEATFDNHQTFDRKSLLGRVLSASYMPMPSEPDHVPMREALDALFDEHQRDGAVRLDYETRVFCGRLR